MTTIKEELDKTISIMTENAANALTEAVIKNTEEKVDRNEIKSEFLTLLNIKNEQNRIESGFKHITDYLQRHCTPLEFETIKNEVDEGLAKFVKLLEEEVAKEKEAKEANETKEFKAPPSNIPQNALGLSDTSYELFFKAGNHLFTNREFENAADVFFTTALFSGLKYGVWIALGFAEQHCGRFQQALNAFAMAALLNFDSPEPYLYGANCCAVMGDKHEAELYLNEAEERIQQDPKKYDEYRDHIINIKNLLK